MMRWIKHLTRACEDEKITVLIATGGLEAYGFYWLLCETVAASIDKDSEHASLVHPVSFWRLKLRTNRHKLLRLLELCSNIALTSHDLSGDMLKVSIPKLLKYRDEWSSRSRVTPEQLPSKELDTHTDTDNTPPTPTKKQRNAAPPLVVDLTEYLRSNHPAKRRDTPSGVTKKLRTLFNPVAKEKWEAITAWIKRDHAAACATDDWQKEEGQFAKGLCNWITANAERWVTTEPEQKPAVREYSGPPRCYLEGTPEYAEAQRKGREETKAFYERQRQQQERERNDRIH